MRQSRLFCTGLLFCLIVFWVVDYVLFDIPLSNKGQPLHISLLRHLRIDDLSDPDAIRLTPFSHKQLWALYGYFDIKELPDPGKTIHQPCYKKHSMLLQDPSWRGLLVHVDQGCNWFDEPTHCRQLIWWRLHAMEQGVSFCATLHPHVVRTHYWLRWFGKITLPP